MKQQLRPLYLIAELAFASLSAMFAAVLTTWIAVSIGAADLTIVFSRPDNVFAPLMLLFTLASFVVAILLLRCRRLARSRAQ